MNFTFTQVGEVLQQAFDNVLNNATTGWVSVGSNLRSTTLGQTRGGDFVHNKNSDLSNLVFKIQWSLTGTENDVVDMSYGMYIPYNGGVGVTVKYIDNNTVKVLTGSEGMWYYDDSNVPQEITSGFYRVIAKAM